MNNYNDIFPFAAYLDNLHRMTESIHSIIPSVGYIANNPLQESMATYERIYHQLMAPFRNMDLGVRLPETLLHTAISEQLGTDFFNIPFLQDTQMIQSIDKILHPLQDIISSNILQNFESHLSFPSDQLTAILDPLFANADAIEFDVSDYVIVNERPIKEICVPDTLVIPLGDFRVKIKTELFVNILFGILSLVTTIVLSIGSAGPSSNTDPIITQVLEWQTRTINSLLNSADTSASSQAEVIEAARAAFEAQIKAAHKQEEASEAQIKAAQAQESAAQALEEAADSIRQAADSMREPEHIEPNK